MDFWKRKLRRSRSSRPASALGMLAFFGIFAAIGLLMSALWTLPAAREALDSESWNPVSATVVESSVKHNTSSDSTTYSIEIIFDYGFDGKNYQSDRWDMIGGSSSGYDSKRRIVDAHPPGMEITVYVNPESPEDAVIKPGLTASALLLLIPVVFFLIGAIGMAVSALKLLRGSQQTGGNRQSLSSFSRERPEKFRTYSPEGQAVLRPRIARWQGALIFLGIVLFWNGIVSIFVFNAFEGWREGDPEWGVILFVSIFALVGLALVGGFLHQLLALRNPHATMSITPAHPRLGGPLRVAWELAGDTSRLQNFKVRLECRESVVRRRGKNTSTTTHVIYREEITHITDRLSMRSGQIESRAPGDAMHSFKAPNYTIEWVFEVHGEIPNWPDLKEEFPFWMDPHNP